MTTMGHHRATSEDLALNGFRIDVDLSRASGWLVSIDTGDQIHRLLPELAALLSAELASATMLAMENNIETDKEEPANTKFRWFRPETGKPVYHATSARGMRLKVFRIGKEWHAESNGHRMNSSGFALKRDAVNFIEELVDA